MLCGSIVAHIVAVGNPPCLPRRLGGLAVVHPKTGQYVALLLLTLLIAGLMALLTVMAQLP